MTAALDRTAVASPAAELGSVIITTELTRCGPCGGWIRRQVVEGVDTEWYHEESLLRACGASSGVDSPSA